MFFVFSFFCRCAWPQSRSANGSFSLKGSSETGLRWKLIFVQGCSKFRSFCFVFAWDGLESIALHAFPTAG